MDHAGGTVLDEAEYYVLFQSDGSPSPVGEFIEIEKLESLLKDDCFRVRCDVSIFKGLSKFPPPCRSSHSPSHSHVLTVDGYSKTTEAFPVGEMFISPRIGVGGHLWIIKLYPCGEAEEVTAYLCLEFLDPNDEPVKVRFEMTMLNLAGETISSTQSFFAFSAANASHGVSFLRGMQPRSSPLLVDGFHVRCDIAIVDGNHGITAVQSPDQRLGADLLASPVGVDVAFKVGGEVFTAHKSVLAARSTRFMAELFGPGKENTVTHVRIDDIEPRVFKALLHFIYTISLPEAGVMAQGLLVAADRYYMERLKLICDDILCNYVDASTAVTTLELADKHGCHRLKEVCIKFLNGMLAKVAAS